MWGKRRKKALHQSDNSTDPYASLRPVETLKRLTGVEHRGSFHQVVEQLPEDEPEPVEPSRNAKYTDGAGIDFSVVRRLAAMTLVLGMFSGATGGITVTAHESLTWLAPLLG